MAKSYDAVVVGAGLGGLSAATELARGRPWLALSPDGYVHACVAYPLEDLRVRVWPERSRP